MNQEQLRARIRERIRSGLLPSGPDVETYGGRGSNSRCACCGDTIGSRDVEYEVYLDDCSDPIRAHWNCYRIWWEERDCGQWNAVMY